MFSRTTACQDRDFPEWHGGRRHALVWALEVSDAGLQSCVDAARVRLGHMVLPRYERAPHVTIAFAGLADEPGLPGYDEEEVARDVALLRPLAGGPVELRPTHWGAFPMVPFLRVAAPWLDRAHAALTTTVDAGNAMDYAMDYVPHVTIGHFSGEWRRDDVLARLAAPLPTAAWLVEALSLLRYETHDIAGPLEAVGRLDLRSGTWSRIAAP